MNINKSFTNKFNTNDHNIEPCGTPETNIFNRVSTLFILTVFFLLFKEEYVKTGVSIENP